MKFSRLVILVYSTDVFKKYFELYQKLLIKFRTLRAFEHETKNLKVCSVEENSKLLSFQSLNPKGKNPPDIYFE
jgi:hypothetical protein